ncbi:hypothetical protein TNIN_364371 [Trichonephila inaurata madagascariensis]|uniref:Uncharacterized protein n=1 Tax=Trichonephila inaurata madagascariensis TaxID=2747483 RepID=A0A8X7BYB4_9ARAC|nr:hypothetical protein TNIN_364371 [Trichonephila inaurata madagascariensis]
MLIHFTQRSLIVNDEVGPMSRPAADPECDPLQPGSIWCGTHGHFFRGVKRSVALKKRMEAKGLRPSGCAEVLGGGRITPCYSPLPILPHTLLAFPHVLRFLTPQYSAQPKPILNSGYHMRTKGSKSSHRLGLL